MREKALRIAAQISMIPGFFLVFLAASALDSGTKIWIPLAVAGLLLLAVAAMGSSREDADEDD